MTKFASFMYCTTHVLQICMYEPLTSQSWRQVVLHSVMVTWPLKKFSVFSDRSEKIFKCLDANNCKQWTHTSQNVYYRQVSISNFFLHDFTLTQHENLHHFLNLLGNGWFNDVWHRFVIIFSLTWFGMDEMWLHFSCVGG
jgi:hypothetical protein